MIVILLGVILGVIGIWFICTRDWEVENKVAISLGSLFVTGLLTTLCVYAFGGLLPDYSEGIREGYITKISKRGYIWKTWEGQIQVGTGEQAALQSPFAFSVTDEDLVQQIHKNLGKRVNMEYREWAVMPFRVGESGYQATKIEVK